MGMKVKETPKGWGSVEEWTSGLAPTTAKKNRTQFLAWMKWIRESETRFAKSTPDELIKHQKQAANGELYDIQDEIVKPFIRQINGRYSYKTRFYSVIRSFFLHNRAELPKDATLTIRGDIEKVQGTLSAEEFRNVVLSCNPKYQAVYLSMFQGAMGSAEFIYWNENGWESLKQQLDEKVHPIRVVLPGRKKSRNKKPYYTLLGSDAIKALNFYVDNHRPRNSEKTVIFYGHYKNRPDPLGQASVYEYWLRHLRKLGYTPPRQKGNRHNRTGKSQHEFRDLFRSQWEKSPAKGSVAEFLMGHKVDPLEYNKAHRDDSWVRKEYLKAEKMLNVMSRDEPFGKVDEDQLTHQDNKITELEAKVAQLEAEKVSVEKNMRQEFEDLKRMIFEELKRT